MHIYEFIPFDKKVIPLRKDYKKLYWKGLYKQNHFREAKNTCYKYTKITKHVYEVKTAQFHRYDDMSSYV